MCVHFFDTRIRVRHPCPFCNLSAAFPEVRMTHWCNQANDVLHLEASDSGQLQEILRYARKSVGAAGMFSDGHSALTITRQCSWDSFPSVTAVANRCGVWLVAPITYLDGSETHRVISPAKKALGQTRRLGHDRIVRAIDLLAEADLDLRGGKAWPDHLVLEVLVARLATMSR